MLLRLAVQRPIVALAMKAVPVGSRQFARVLLLALIAALFPLASCSRQTPAQTLASKTPAPLPVPPLFTELIVEATVTFPEKAVSKRHQFVDVQPAALVELAQGDGRVQIALPGRGRFTVTVTRRDENPVATIAYGTLEEVPGSQVILTAVEDKLSGRVILPDGALFQIISTADGHHCVFEVNRKLVDVACEPPTGAQPASIRDANGGEIKVAYQTTRWRALLSQSQSALTPMLAASNGAGNRSALRGTQRGQAGSSGNKKPASGNSVSSKKGSSKAGGSSGGGGTTQIDAVLFYTAAVAKAKGGDAGAKAFAASGVADVNDAFANSGIKVKVNLVAVQAYNYVESGDLGKDLSNFNGDDAVKSARDDKKADLISLLVDGPDAGSAGIGALLQSETGNPGACCSVVVYKHVLTNHTLAHEMGHNLGSNHCWDQSGDGVFAYSHGHRWTGTDGKNYRSIMSYAKDGDERTGQFSNPAMKHQGAATGDKTKADNARGFTATAVPASKYR